MIISKKKYNKLADQAKLYCGLYSQAQSDIWQMMTEVTRLKYENARLRDVVIDDFPKLIKERAHPEDGCGLDCVYVHEIDEIMKELTEEPKENDQT